MKEVIVRTKCDYPDCDVRDDTTPYSIWGYTHARGRKPAPVQIDLCEKHRLEIAALIDTFYRVGSIEYAAHPENRKNA
jgi:hypothetical protein